ncbi:MAG: tetratricopeptide repeat protein [Beijerinckiaceae bacterium]
MTLKTGQPSVGEVRAALGAILDDALFRDSPQLAAFLAFVVEETLAGRGAELKGYSIATRALGRPESFDPQSDPIVRVQAGRVRQALTAYYAANKTQGIVISLNRGTYTPQFEHTEQGSVPSSGRTDPLSAIAAQPEPPVAEVEKKRHRPLIPALLAITASVVLAVLAMLAIQADRIAAPDFTPSVTVEGEPAAASQELARLVNRTRDALARFDDIVVVREATSERDAAAGRLLLRLGTDPATGGDGRVRARLIDQSDQRVLWTRAFEPSETISGGADRETAVVRAIAATLAQPYGVIHAHARTLLAGQGGRTGPYGCLVAGFDYWHVNDAASHGAVRRCLLDKAEQYPTAAAIHAQLAYAHLEEFRQGYNPMSGDPRARALASANAAVRHAPASARAQQSLLAAHFARGDMDAAWRAAGEALRLNPYDTEILQDVGARHIQSGHFEKGLAMIEEALALNASPPHWALTFRALALYMLGRLDQSGPAALRMGATQYPPAMIALVMAAFQFRDLEGGKRSLGELERLHPAIVRDVGAYLDRLNFAPVVRDQVVRDFSSAAAWVKKSGN